MVQNALTEQLSKSSVKRGGINLAITYEDEKDVQDENQEVEDIKENKNGRLRLCKVICGECFRQGHLGIWQFLFQLMLPFIVVIYATQW